MKLGLDFNSGVNAAKDFIMDHAIQAFRDGQFNRAKELRGLAEKLTIVMKFPSIQEPRNPEPTGIDVQISEGTCVHERVFDLGDEFLGPDSFGGEDYPSDYDCDLAF